MGPICIALLLAAAPDPGSALVEKALKASGGRAALAAQTNVWVHTTSDGGDRLVLIDHPRRGVRVEDRVKRRAQRVRGRVGNAAWDFRRGPIPAKQLDLPVRSWLPARLLLDEKVKVERVAGAPAGHSRLLLSYPGGDLIHLDVSKRSGHITRLAGFDHDNAPFVVRYASWKRYGAHWLPTALTLEMGERAVVRTVKSARFDGPINDRFFLAPGTGREL